MPPKGSQLTAQSSSRSLFAIVLVAQLAIVGCGAKETASISGAAKFNDAPIPEGTVRFHPVGSTTGAGAGAKIVDGKYEIASGAGLVPGDYLVAVNAWKETGEEIPNPEPLKGEPEMIAEVVQYIPEKYNQRSTLHVQVVKGANEEDFALEADTEVDAAKPDGDSEKKSETEQKVKEE